MMEIDEDILLVADDESMRKLKDAWNDVAPVDDMVAYAQSLGVNPPDDREGWDIIYNWGPHDEDLGLAWYHSDDDPLADDDDEGPE